MGKEALKLDANTFAFLHEIHEEVKLKILMKQMY